MPAKTPDTQRHNSWKAYTFEKECQAQHGDADILLLGGSCRVEDDDAGKVSEEDPSVPCELNDSSNAMALRILRREDSSIGGLPSLDKLHKEGTAESTYGKTALGDGKVDGTCSRRCA